MMKPIDWLSYVTLSISRAPSNVKGTLYFPKSQNNSSANSGLLRYRHRPEKGEKSEKWGETGAWKRTDESMRESSVKLEVHVSPERDHVHHLPQLLLVLAETQCANPGRLADRRMVDMRVAAESGLHEQNIFVKRLYFIARIFRMHSQPSGSFPSYHSCWRGIHWGGCLGRLRGRFDRDILDMLRPGLYALWCTWLW